MTSRGAPWTPAGSGRIVDGVDGVDAWDSGPAYDRFMGRWSGLVARELLDWLGLPAGLRWVELGCGTGALTAALVERSGPSQVVAVDPSPGFVERATERFAADPQVTVAVGDSSTLVSGSADVAVTGLVLNFVPDPLAAVHDLAGACAPGGTVAAYVWDYAGHGMEMLSVFWDAAREHDRSAGETDQAGRFAAWTADLLPTLWRQVGLRQVEARALEVRCAFEGPEDFWQPFLGGTGPAPAYVAGLGGADRERLQQTLVRRLGPDPFTLGARAWAARGVVPD